MANEQILRAQNATYALLDSQAPAPDCCVHWRPGLQVLYNYIHQVLRHPLQDRLRMIVRMI